jgi:hypothetical protein
MAEEIVRCPYCVLDDHVFPMLLRPGGWFVCQKWPHRNPREIRFQMLLSKVRRAESGSLIRSDKHYA